MISRFLAIAMVGTLFASACDHRLPIAPAELQEPSFALAPADGNGSKVIIPVQNFTFEVDCGTQTLQGVINGFLQIRDFTRSGTRNVEVLTVNFLFTITNSAGASISWREVGIDHFTIDRNGNLLRALTGRAGEFGVIGRIVINQDTGQFEFIAGNDVGILFENACALLT